MPPPKAPDCKRNMPKYVSYKLRLLKNLGAVDYERNGKIITYFLKDDAISDMLFKGMEFLGG